jgi:hypothetical protein
LLVNEFARGGTVYEVLPRAFKDEYLPALFRRTFERSDEATCYAFLLINLSSSAHSEDLLTLCCVGRGYEYSAAKRGLLGNHLMDEPLEEAPGKYAYRTSWAAEQFAKTIVIGHPLQRAVEQDVEMLLFIVKELGRNITPVNITGLLDATVDEVTIRHRNRRILDWLRTHDPESARGFALKLVRATESDPAEVRTACKTAVELDSADAELWLTWARFERSQSDFARALDLTLRAVDMLDGQTELRRAAGVMLGVMSEPTFKGSNSFERRGVYTRSLTSRLEAMKAELTAESLATLAWLYLQTNDQKHAAEALKAGLQKDPDNANLLRLEERFVKG